MAELTLESLARRLEEVERRLNEKEASNGKDWRSAAGMFTGREFSKIVDEEAEKFAKRIGKTHARSSGSDPSGHHHLTVLKYADSARHARLSGRLLAAAPELIGTTIINVEEQMRGWFLSALSRFPDRASRATPRPAVSSASVVRERRQVLFDTYRPRK